MPLMNAAGTNTAHSTSAIAMTGPDTSSIALRVASSGDSPCSMCRSTFSTTTIASSTTMPIASTRPNSVRLFSEKPSSEHHRERADQRHRHGDQRDERRAPGLQEHEHDDDDQHDRLEQRVDHLVDRLADEERGVVDDAVLDAVGERLLQAFHRLAHLRRRLERVGAGELEDADRDRRLVVEQAAQRVACSSRARSRADVAQADDLPVRRRADDDVAELLLGGQPALAR